MSNNLGEDLIELIAELLKIPTDEVLIAQNSKGMTDNNGRYIEY